MWLASNHTPAIRGTDYAISDRVKLIPFTVQIPPAEQDPELPEKLKAELSGILNWALLGLTESAQGGLREPAAVRMATDEYRSEEHTLAAFIDEKCEVGPGPKTTAAALYRAFPSGPRLVANTSCPQLTLAVRWPNVAFSGSTVGESSDKASV